MIRNKSAQLSFGIGRGGKKGKGGKGGKGTRRLRPVLLANCCPSEKLTGSRPNLHLCVAGLQTRKGKRKRGGEKKGGGTEIGQLF